MDIKEIIYEVRGKKVILVKNVAKLLELGNGTKELNQIVKRNIEKFSNENYFQLTKEEYEICVQGRKFATINDNFVTINDNFVTLKNLKSGRGNHIKYLPFVFTIDGIKVLKRILKSKEMDVIFNKIIEVLEEENNTLMLSNSQEFREENIKSMIYEIRGKQVMLDFDLARLYECNNGAKTINLAVKRHIKRFPERFMFQLTNYEFMKLRFQLETANMIRSLPYAFTEEGVAMLATILRTSVAEEVSIKIMDTFVAMRKYISNDLIEQKYINNLVMEHDTSIKLLQKSFLSLEEKKKVSEIYFNGQIYDAYSKIIEIVKEARKELIIIDNYADNTILDMIRRLKVRVTIITKKNSLLSAQDLDKYNKQYNNLKVIYDDTFHDRYFILDEDTIYHCGASINRIGYKTFSITLLSDTDICKILIDRVNKIKKLTFQ